MAGDRANEGDGKELSRRRFVGATAAGLLGSLLQGCKRLPTTSVQVLPSASFLSDAQGLSEAGGQLEVVVGLSEASIKDVMIPFVVGGTARQGTDYTISSSPVRIPAGETSTSIVLSVVDDGLVESEETVVLSLEAPTNAVLGERPQTTVTFTDTGAVPSTNPRCDPGTYVRPSTPRTGPILYCDAAATGGGTGTEGSPYNLAEMLSNLAAGCLVYMKGDFGAGSFMNLSNVSGTATQWIVFRRWPGESIQPVLRSGSSGYSPVYIRGSSFIAIEDMRLVGATSDGAVYIADGASHIHVMDCTITSPRAGWSTGITVGHSARSQGVSNVWIEGNSVNDIGGRLQNAGEGIWIEGGTSTSTTDVVVVRNDVGNCGHAGISVNIGGQVVDGAIIAQNTIHNTWDTGISTTRARNVLIECNDIANTATHPDSPTVANSHEGIILSGSEDGVVRYNRIWNSWGAAIVLQANVFQGTQTCVRNRIYNNTAYGNGGAFNMVCRAGLSAVTHMADNVVENNLYYSNHRGGETQYDVGSGQRGCYYNGNYHRVWIDLSGAGEGWPAGSLNGNIFRNNWFARNATDSDNWCIIVGSTNTYYTLAEFEALNASSGNIDVGDPMMMNPGANDFRLQPSSGCIDFGLPIPGVDYMGTAPDAGALESA